MTEICPAELLCFAACEECHVGLISRLWPGSYSILLVHQRPPCYCIITRHEQIALPEPFQMQIDQSRDKDYSFARLCDLKAHVTIRMLAETDIASAKANRQNIS
jgi:hypothetical protein